MNTLPKEPLTPVEHDAAMTAVLCHIGSVAAP